MSVLILLSPAPYRFLLLRILSRLILRTILTLLHIYFYKSFSAICTHAYVINARLYSVSHTNILTFCIRKTPLVQLYSHTKRGVSYPYI